MKKPKMNKPSKNVILFIIIAFLLPLMIVATQSRDLNNAIGFVLYGIQAAAPSIAAIVVFVANKELKVSFSRLFHKDYLTRAIFLPAVIVCVVMIAAKLLSSLIIGEHNSFFGAVSCKQWVLNPLRNNDDNRSCGIICVDIMGCKRKNRQSLCG